MPRAGLRASSRSGARRSKHVLSFTWTKGGLCAISAAFRCDFIISIYIHGVYSRHYWHYSARFYALLSLFVTLIGVVALAMLSGIPTRFAVVFNVTSLQPFLMSRSHHRSLSTRALPFAFTVQRRVDSSIPCRLAAPLKCMFL